MRMNQLKPLFILLAVLLTIGCSAHTSYLFEKPSGDWPTQCQALRKALLAEPKTSVTYSQLPKDKPTAPLWVVNLHDIPIPVPAVPYREIFLTRGESGRISSISFTGQEREKVIIFYDPVGPPSEDVFATVEKGETDEGRRLTKQIFGGTVSFDRLMDWGNSHKPEELTCEMSRQAVEMPISYALIYKAMSYSDSLSAIHKGVGQLPGWIAFSTSSAERPENAAWQAHIFNSEYTLITIHIGRESVFKDIGLGIGRANLIQAMNRPSWLDAFSAAVNADRDPKLWNALIESLTAAGFSRQSIERVRKVTPK